MKFSVSTAILAGAVMLTKHAVFGQGVLDTDDSVVTPIDNVISALLATNQTEGVPADAYPSEPIQATEIATNSSEVIETAERRRGLFQPVFVNKGNVAKRNTQLAERARDWQTIYDGTLSSTPDYSTAAVQMPAYLTYKLVSNTTTYASAKANCLSFCEKTAKCASANLYYEFENPLLDWTFSEKSNLKCALYGDIPTLNQFTNKGGQQQKPKPYPLTYITKSSAFANPYPLENVATPSGYTLSYGPISAANNEPTYMGFKFLTQYDADACGKLCDSTKGCSSFNIWRGVVNGDPRTYTCSMYSGLIDQTTAVNTGDDVNKVKVTYSRGYVSTAAAKAKADADAKAKAEAAAAAAKAKCVSDSAGFAWTYIPRSDAQKFQCYTDGTDVSALPAFSTASASGVAKNTALSSYHNYDSRTTFYPFGSSTGVPSDYFSILTKGYFKAPKTATYKLQLNGDDAARAWFGDKAKSGWTADNADLTVTCSGNSKTFSLSAGDLLPIRLEGTNGPGHFNLQMLAYDENDAEIDISSAWTQDGCDGVNGSFDW